jgi:hypothetical protein
MSKLTKHYGRGLKKIAKNSSDKIAETLGLKKEDVDKFLAGDAELEVEKGGTEDVAEAAGVSVAELAEAALDAEAEEQKSQDDAAKKAEEDAAKKAEEDAAKKDADAIKKEKRDLNKKFNIVPVGDGAQRSSKSGSQNTDAMTRAEIIKSASGAIFRPELIKMLTKGVIEPGFVSPGGELTPDQSQAILSLVVDRAGFLNKVQRVNMNSTKQDVTVWDISGRKFSRQKSGYFPSSADHAATVMNKSIRLEAEKVNLDIILPIEATRAHKGNWAAMEADLLSNFGTHAGNETLDLAFNGVGGGNPTEEATWEELLEGWLSKASDLVPGDRQISYADITATVPKDTWDAAFAEVAALRRYFSGAELVISGEDWELHEQDLITRTDATPFLINGAPMTYRKRPVNDIDYLAPKRGLYSNLKNLVLGFVNEGSDAFRVSTFTVPDALMVRFTGFLATGFVNAEDGIVLFNE